MNGTLFLLVALASLASGQTIKTGDVSSSGTCSPPQVGSQNVYILNCNGISKEKAAELVKLLNGVLHRQIDPKLVYSELDTIEKGIKDLQESFKQVQRREEQSAPLQLEDAQKTALVEALRTYAGQKIVVMIPLGDGVAQHTAEQFIGVLNQAGWLDPSGKTVGTSQGVFNRIPVGIGVGISKEEAEANKPPPAATGLVLALRQLGLAAIPFASEQVTSGTVELLIGGTK